MRHPDGPQCHPCHEANRSTKYWFVCIEDEIIDFLVAANCQPLLILFVQEFLNARNWIGSMLDDGSIVETVPGTSLVKRTPTFSVHDSFTPKFEEFIRSHHSSHPSAKYYLPIFVKTLQCNKERGSHFRQSLMVLLRKIPLAYNGAKEDDPVYFGFATTYCNHGKWEGYFGTVQTVPIDQPDRKTRMSKKN